LTPAIRFESIQKITKTSNDGFGGKAKIDSVIMSIRFEDGDGDLGITAAEIKANSKYKDFRNFEVDVMLRKNGKFVPVTFSPNIRRLNEFSVPPGSKTGSYRGFHRLFHAIRLCLFQGLFTPIYGEKRYA